MTPVMRVCAIALICAVLGLLLREAGFRGSRLVTLMGVVALLGIGASGLASILDFLTEVGADMTSGGSGAGGSSQNGEIIAATGKIIDGATRIVGLGYVFGICSDVCRELGEIGVANSILVVGRVEIFLATLPYLDTLLGLVRGLVG